MATDVGSVSGCGTGAAVTAAAPAASATYVAQAAPPPEVSGSAGLQENLKNVTDNTLFGKNLGGSSMFITG